MQSLLVKGAGGLAEGDADAWMRLARDESVSTRDLIGLLGMFLADVTKHAKEAKRNVPTIEPQHDDCGRLQLRIVTGSKSEYVRVPCVVDRGVWRRGQTYLKGDAVSHQRSLFICQRDHPSGMPADGSHEWRLGAMRGRDATFKALDVEA